MWFSQFGEKMKCSAIVIIMSLPLFDFYWLYPIIYYPIFSSLAEKNINCCLCMGKVKFLLPIRLCIFLMRAMVMMYVRQIFFVATGQWGVLAMISLKFTNSHIESQTRLLHWLCVCVCVCVLVLRFWGGILLNMHWQALVPPPQWRPLQTLEPSSTTALDPLGGLLERFLTDSCILDVGLHGSCCWATPQPRNLSLQVVNTRTLCKWEPAQRRRAELKLGIGAIVVTCQYSAHCYSAVRSRNQVPILYRETRRPHSSCTKVQTRISY